MIIEAFISLQFLMVNFIISLIPSNILEGVTSHATGLLSLLSISARFIPWDVVVLCLGAIIFWVGVHLVISIIRFVLDFIPFF